MSQEPSPILIEKTPPRLKDVDLKLECSREEYEDNLTALQGEMCLGAGVAWVSEFAGICRELKNDEVFTI